MKTFHNARGPSIHAIAIAVIDGNELEFDCGELVYLAKINSISSCDQQGVFVIKGDIRRGKRDPRQSFTAEYYLERYTVTINEPEQSSHRQETMPCAS